MLGATVIEPIVIVVDQETITVPEAEQAAYERKGWKLYGMSKVKDERFVKMRMRREAQKHGAPRKS